MALYGARRGSQGMPQSMVGFLSADPIVVAVANVGAWVGAAILLWQGGRRAYKAGTYIYHNSVRSWIDMERRQRNIIARCLCIDGILLSAYKLKHTLRCGLSAFFAVLFLILVAVFRLNVKEELISSYDRATLIGCMVVVIAMVIWTAVQSLMLLGMMHKVFYLRNDLLIERQEEYDSESAPPSGV